MDIAHLNIILEGNNVRLMPLAESHFDELAALAANPKIWQYYAMDGSDPDKMRKILEDALIQRTAGIQYPFVIADRSSGKLIGSTRLLDIQPLHRKLEIGWTWMHPDHWGSGINLECKLLLLAFCFQELKVCRVQLKTDENNIRSRKAIEKIGGRFEGILRHDMLRENGTHRNSAYYSILDSEWDPVKKQLGRSISER